MSTIVAEHFAYLDWQNPNTNVSSGDGVTMKDTDILCLKFLEAATEDLLKSLPSEIDICIPLGTGQRPDMFDYRVWACSGEWNHSTATYYNQPSTSGEFAVSDNAYPSSTLLVLTISGDPGLIRQALLNGIQIQFVNGGNYGVYVYTPSSSTKPYSELTFGGPAEYYIGSTLPSSGAILSAGSDNTFTWAIESGDVTLGEIEVLSSIFYWKNTSAGSSTYQIDAEGNLRVVLPANTITPSSSIDTVEWYVEMELSNEATIQSAWQEVRFQEGLIKAALVFPVNTDIRIDEDNVFSWNVIGSGTQKGIQFTLTQNGENLINVQTIPYLGHTYTVPAGTLSKGPFTWSVTLQNGVGEWGEEVSVEANAAAKPAYPTSVSLTKNTPRFELSWTNAPDVNQIGFEIIVIPLGYNDWERCFYPEVSDKYIHYKIYVSGSDPWDREIWPDDRFAKYRAYSSETKYHHTDIIPVGSYDIIVRILDASGEWSDWIGIGDVEIKHAYALDSASAIIFDPDIGQLRSSELLCDIIPPSETSIVVEGDAKFPQIHITGDQITGIFDRGIRVIRTSTSKPYGHEFEDITHNNIDYSDPWGGRGIRVGSEYIVSFVDWTANDLSTYYVLFCAISISTESMDWDSRNNDELIGDYVEFWPNSDISTRSNFNILVDFNADSSKYAAYTVFPIYLYNEYPHTYQISDTMEQDFETFGNSLKPVPGVLKSKSRTYNFSCLTDECYSGYSDIRNHLNPSDKNPWTVPHSSCLESMIGRQVLLKDIEGHVIIGILSSASRTVNSEGFSIWECSITECNIPFTEVNKWNYPAREFNPDTRYD